MDENSILEQLEELEKSFGIQIRSEAIKQDDDLVKVVGGLRLLKGEYVSIINSKATEMDRIWTLATALRSIVTEEDIDHGRRRQNEKESAVNRRAEVLGKAKNS